MRRCPVCCDYRRRLLWMFELREGSWFSRLLGRKGLVLVFCPFHR